VARVLIVGCGCRGLELAAALLTDGHAVRGTTRRESRLDEIEATGSQAAVADPDRLSTLMPHIDGVSVLCWLMGTAEGEPEAIAAIHGPRLQSLLEKLVDTHVRGLVYEAAGGVERRWLEQGAALVRRARETYRMPSEVVQAAPADHAAWLSEMTAAVGRVLAA
jgi:NADP-dependent 3-hydroxy acid dehydrogenase YdfG